MYVFIDCDDFFWLRKNYNLYNFRYIFKVVVFDKNKDFGVVCVLFNICLMYDLNCFNSFILIKYEKLDKLW